MTSHGISATRHRSFPLSASWSARGAEQARIGGLLHCVATLRVRDPAMTPPLGRLSEGPDGRG